MDNQIIQRKSGLLGMFEGSMPSFNRMLRTAHLTLPIEYKGKEQQISVVVGDICNHYGAEMEYIPVSAYDMDSHQFSDTDSKEVLVCRCGDVFMPTDDGGEWV